MNDWDNLVPGLGVTGEDEGKRVIQSKEDEVMGFQVAAEVKRDPSRPDKDIFVKGPGDLQSSVTSALKGGWL